VALPILTAVAMNISAPFIARPVATILLTVGIALAGVLAFTKLPVAPLPQVDFPTIQVTARLPGASPDTVATSVAEPLERHLGQIADVTQMISQSSLGQTQIVLQFGLDRNIDGAARDVEAAINAARADLPSDLRSNPTYRKVNPANAPILILAMTSKTLSGAQLYDAAANAIQQRLSQLPGIGQSILGGAAMPAVRVELNPLSLFHYGVGLEDIRAALASANADSPKGTVDDHGTRWQIYTNDQASRASEYEPLIVGWRNGAAIHLTDLGKVVDSVEDVRNVGIYNGKSAVMAVLYRRPGANVIETIDAVKAELPHLQATLPGDVHIALVGDPSTTIRRSLGETQLTLIMAVVLVTLVVFAFLRDWRATLIPAIAVPVSIIGTFGAMYLLGFSLDNLSLMALTISTGFVVDDAIVVLENIARQMEAGVPRLTAALQGAREVGFTVVSISLSLIAVFIPLLLMGGIVGRLFREFALTLCVAILISLGVSLSTTPMLCSLFLRAQTENSAKRQTLFNRVQLAYARSLNWALRHSAITLLVLLLTIVLNVMLFARIPKGFFPEQDTGRLLGTMTADQSVSFQLMREKLSQAIDVVRNDVAVDSVVGFSGGGGGARSQTNAATVYVALKPRNRRSDIAAVTSRLRQKLSQLPGATLYLTPVQDLSSGARQASAAYQYTLQGDDSEQLYSWTPKLTAALQRDRRLVDVNSDQQQAGLQTVLRIDRDAAARLGISPLQIDSTLYDAFGQRQVSVIYADQNQYHVVMEVDPRYWQDPGILGQMWVGMSGGTVSGTQATNIFSGAVSTPHQHGTAVITPDAAQAARNASTNSIANVGHGTASAGTAVSTARQTMIPLAAVTAVDSANTPLTVNHQGPFVATTISFNLPAGRSLSEAMQAVADAGRQIGLPASIHGTFSGTAEAFRQSLASEPLLLMAALVAMYIVLGVLYESAIHPLTILSTLPSAGVGAVLALALSHTEFSVIALIGVILLIGIVTKNAIMMIDFAIAAQRGGAMNPREAIGRACRLRFRPIVMTTLAAALGALPLIVSTGEGSELRRPLGLSIVGGLAVSQILTLYTTPVVYLYLERLQPWARRRRTRVFHRSTGIPEAAK
jgi:multidrug efflux pump